MDHEARHHRREVLALSSTGSSDAVWTADIAVDAALVARLVAAQFPQLAGAPVEPFGIGWDNAAFLVDGRVLFRFPRRRVAAALIEREIAFLPGIAPLVPLAISAPAYAGVSSEAYPWVFAGYPLIAGTTACASALTGDTRAAMAEPLGRFLRALHAIDAAPLAARGLPRDEIGRLDHDKRLRMTRERLPLLAAAGLAPDPRLIAWLEAHPPIAPADADLRLVHGDLYARHVVLDAARQPVAVIDWGDVHVGDPAIDLSIAHLMLPARAHAAFRAAYGPIDDRTWNAAKYRAIYHAVLELDYGLRENDAGMRRIGNAALRLAGEAPAEA